MFINEEVLARGFDPGALFALFHTQRTGGSEFTRCLSNVFGSERVYYFRNVENWQHWEMLDDAALSGFRFFSGFSNYRDTGLSRPVVAFSMVRHPLYRVASLYEISRERPRLRLHRIAKESSFEEFYERSTKELPNYLKSLCTRRISDSWDFGKALKAMNETFGIVSTTAELARMIERLANYYGWDVTPLAQHVPDEEKYAAYLSSPISKRIASDNAADIELYTFLAGNT